MWPASFPVRTAEPPPLAGRAKGAIDIYVESSHRTAYRWARLAEALLCPRHSEQGKLQGQISVEAIVGRTYWRLRIREDLVAAATRIGALLGLAAQRAVLCPDNMFAPAGFMLKRDGPAYLLSGGELGAWPGQLPPLSSDLLQAALRTAGFSGPQQWVTTYWPWMTTCRPWIPSRAYAHAIRDWVDTYGTPAPPAFG